MTTGITGGFRPLGNGIAVQNMEFGEVKTASVLILTSDNGKARGVHPRWGQVTHVGPDQQDVKVGQYILVAHGRWSRGFELNGKTLRPVDPKDVLGVQDEPPQAVYTPSLGHQTQSYQGKVGVGKLDVGAT